ncbi:ABC transporter substrate-binding protein [Pigmentiphaga sp. H8]|nr:ABC transporter substrate-binding protein [Pigmentiphaga sp. H8]
MAAPLAASWAADMTLILDDTIQQYGEFAAQMRSVNAASHRLTQGKVDILPLDSLRQLDGQQAAAPRSGPDDGDSVLAGVRTRSARGSMLPDTGASASPPPARAEGSGPGVLVAVGPRAARAVVLRAGNEPVLLALLGRLEYEELRALPALRRPDRAIGVLLRDPAAAEQLSLIDAVLPGKRRVGVVTAPQAEPLMRELASAALTWPAQHPSRGGRPWAITAADAPDSHALTGALQTVVPASDALLVLPDPVGSTSAAALALLQSAATANLPVFATSEAMVRAGALAALVPGNAQLAEQAHALTLRLRQAPPGPPVVEAPRRLTVRTNPHVARRLGLALPPDDDLTAAVARRD